MNQVQRLFYGYKLYSKNQTDSYVEFLLIKDGETHPTVDIIVLKRVICLDDMYTADVKLSKKQRALLDLLSNLEEYKER